jgi:hypothetical protein
MTDLEKYKKVIIYDYQYPPVKFEMVDEVEEYSINEFDVVKLNNDLIKGRRLTDSESINLMLQDIDFNPNEFEKAIEKFIKVNK